MIAIISMRCTTYTMNKRSTSPCVDWQASYRFTSPQNKFNGYLPIDHDIHTRIPAHQHFRGLPFGSMCVKIMSYHGHVMRAVTLAFIHCTHWGAIFLVFLPIAIPVCVYFAFDRILQTGPAWSLCTTYLDRKWDRRTCMGVRTYFHTTKCCSAEEMEIMSCGATLLDCHLWRMQGGIGVTLHTWLCFCRQPS